MNVVPKWEQPKKKKNTGKQGKGSRKRKGPFWFSDFFLLACLEDFFIGGKKILFSGGVGIAFGSSLCLGGY
jgi:hypothetical protein